MKMCPQCSAELKPGDRAESCAVCLFAGAVDTDFTFSEPEAQTSTEHLQTAVDQEGFGPYQIVSLLGEGGMGTVYLAEQTEPIHRRVALKVVKLGMDTNQVLARFNQERHALARMDHSGIARILDAGASARGRPFFVMDFVDGASITAWSDRYQLTTAQRLELFLPVCRAVQHANNKGIIHRDIKPSNVLVTLEDGKPIPKVIDFGIARAIEPGIGGATFTTQFGQLVGTPEYASPEQADMVNGEISAAADVYSLGVLLYELLAGVVPFDADFLRKAGFSEMLRIVREDEAPSMFERLNSLGSASDDIAARRGTDATALRKLLTGDLNRILKKALEKSPQQRYASPSELAADIERHMKGEPVLAGPARQTSDVPRGSKPRSAVINTIVLSDVANDTGDSSFDSLFRQSISFELQRSKNLEVLPDSRVAETLNQMRKTAQTRVTAEIAREIGQRTTSAALIESSLSRSGSGYLLTLCARNCTDGSLLAQEQAQAAGKNDVLTELRRLATRLQSKVAKPFAALQRIAIVLDAATTSSLEALKSFSIARQRIYSNRVDSILLFKRSIELDPEFATAYAWLGRTQADSGEQNLAVVNIREAYRLRDLASDRENFFITYNYNREVLRNFELCRQVCDSWVDKYPGDLMPHGLLSGLISAGTAQYEKAIEQAEKAVALDPDFTIGYQNMALSFLALNRLEDAKTALQRDAQRKSPSNDFLMLRVQFFAAFLNRDRNAMDKAAAQMSVASPHGVTEHCQSLVFACEGRLQQSRQASIQAVTLACHAHFVERAALFEGAAAVREALCGYPADSLRHSLAAGQLAQGRDADFPRAFAFALSGNVEAALPIVAQLEKQYPEDTCVRFSYAPALRALLAIEQGGAVQAINLLTVSKPYELAQTGVSCYFCYGAMYPTYVRGLAFQKIQKTREASAEFQRMLDYPGLLLADPIGPAARLQLARSLRDGGEPEKAKGVYTEFLTLWRDADPRVPLFEQAKSEFIRL